MKKIKDGTDLNKKTGGVRKTAEYLAGNRRSSIVKSLKKEDAARAAKDSTYSDYDRRREDVSAEAADTVKDYENKFAGTAEKSLKDSGTKAKDAIKKRVLKEYTVKKRSTGYELKKGGTTVKNTVNPIKKTKKAATAGGKAGAKASVRAQKAAIRAAKRPVREVIKMTVKTLINIVKETLKGMTEFLMACGAGEIILIIIAVIIIIIFCFVLIMLSVYAYKSSGNGLVTDDNKPALMAAVESLNEEMAAKVEEIKKTEGPYDTCEISNGSTVVSNWKDVFLVYITKVKDSGRDTDSIDTELLRSTYWEMNSVDSTIEMNEHGTRILYINIHSADYLSYARWTGMTDEQIEEMKELELFADETIKGLTGTYVDISLTDEEIQKIMTNLQGESADRQKVVQVAYSLIGKVGYFWGGKSYVSGWDSRWGSPTLVTATGDETTGTYQPYGLDCSGFIGWVFAQAYGGYRCTQGAANQYNNWCSHISWSDAKPGDLVFFADLSHVGVVAGKGSDGTMIIIHCSVGAGGVTIGSYRQDNNAFCLVGRPSNLS